MNPALLLTAVLMGLAGSLHCAAMCGATSAGVVRACGGARPAPAWAGFHLGRLAGYALAGAVVASSVGLLGRLGEWSPALRPVWGLAHLAALGLGLWLLVTARQPAWLAELGRGGPRGALAVPQGWQRVRGPAQAAAIGSLWAAWPCGLFQSALVVAALANGPWGGAAVMLGFALASSLALGLAPALLARWARRRPGAQGRVTTAAVRFSGAVLAGASAWALGHGLWERAWAACFG